MPVGTWRDQNQGLVSVGGGNLHYQYALYYRGGQDLCVYNYGGSGHGSIFSLIGGTFPADDATWSHVVATWRYDPVEHETHVKGYINGVEVLQTTQEGRVLREIFHHNSLSRAWTFAIVRAISSHHQWRGEGRCRQFLCRKPNIFCRE